MARKVQYSREVLEKASLPGEREVIARLLVRVFSAKVLDNASYAIGLRASVAREKAEQTGFGTPDGARFFMGAEDLDKLSGIFNRARVLASSPAGVELCNE